MSIILNNDTKQYALHPEGGPYSAVLSEIRSHEDVETAFGTKELTFQTTEKLRDHENDIDDDRPMTISSFVNPTFDGKGRLMGPIARLVPVVELVLSDGKVVDIEDLLVGTQWLLTIEHNDSGGKTYANISAAMKAPAEQHLSPWEEN